MKNRQTFSSTFINNKTGSLRAMFYNVFGYTWFPDKSGSPHLSSGPIALRQEMEEEVIRAYSPDVLGMQEYSAAFHKGMTPRLLVAGYTEVEACHTETHEDGTRFNYTPIFYRSDSVRLIDSGFVMYPLTSPDIVGADGKELNINDVSSKSLTWAVFEEIATGKRFIAICTHFMYSAYWLSREQQKKSRVINAEILLKTVKDIRGKEGFSGLPVIMGGDLNCHFGEPCFDLLIDNGMEWVHDAAVLTDGCSGVKSFSVYDSNKGEYVKCYAPANELGKAIDHVFRLQGDGENKMYVSTYVTVTDRKALLSSDHCPKFADFTLTKIN